MFLGADNEIDNLLIDVCQFHNKFNVPIEYFPTIPNQDRIKLRYDLMREEVEEYLNAETIQDISDALADILYSTLGSFLEHGLQEFLVQIWDEVHKSNMTKEYAEFKIKKGKEYIPPDLSFIKTKEGSN